VTNQKNTLSKVKAHRTFKKLAVSPCFQFTTQHVDPCAAARMHGANCQTRLLGGGRGGIGVPRALESATARARVARPRISLQALKKPRHFTPWLTTKLTRASSSLLHQSPSFRQSPLRIPPPAPLIWTVARARARDEQRAGPARARARHGPKEHGPVWPACHRAVPAQPIVPA